MTTKQVQCMVCKQMLTYTGDNTSVLIDHLNMNHSDVEVFRYLGGVNAGDASRQKGANGKWNPNQSLECPHCEKLGKPIVQRRTRNQKRGIIANLFWCWPMCCPFLWLGHGNVLHVYCSSCHRYYGYYDPDKGKLVRSNIEPQTVKNKIHNQ